MWQQLSAAAVNDYIRDVAGPEFSAKDLRTRGRPWALTASRIGRSEHSDGLVPSDDGEPAHSIGLDGLQRPADAAHRLSGDEV